MSLSYLAHIDLLKQEWRVAIFIFYKQEYRISAISDLLLPNVLLIFAQLAEMDPEEIGQKF